MRPSLVLSGYIVLAASIPWYAAPATAAPPAPVESIPLEQVLQPGGTLDLNDFRGSLNTSGWRLTREADGAPRFVRDDAAGGTSAPEAVAPPGLDMAGDDCWNSLTNGTSGPTGAFALDGAGHFYAGGDFTFAGGSPANNIAMWNGSTWSALGAGTNGAVIALALDGSGNLYAGGVFTQAGGAAANHVARWDGSSWHAVGAGIVGGGVDDIVYTLLWRGGVLYAGGSFAHADGNLASRVARWDGSTWTAMGSGFNSIVRALAMDGGGTLYAGGYFSQSGVTTVRGIGQWDPSSGTWGQVGAGLNTGGVVWGLALDGSLLYAAGQFSNIGGVPASNIGKWDPGTGAWSALGAGVDFLGAISVAVSPNHHVFAGGYFTHAGGITAIYVAEWDGTNWSPLGAHVNGNVGVLLVDPAGGVYVGGGLTVAGGAPANNVARWDGSKWSVLGGGVDAPALCVALDGLGNLYAGGLFIAADGLPASRVVKFDGAHWSALGQGMNGFVYALAPDGLGTVYAGGSFTTADGATANRVARWDGSGWHPLGSGMNSTVRTLVLDRGVLYAGGYFTTADGNPSPGVARWNGSSWTSLGTGMSGPGIVWSLARDGLGGVYAGGSFNTAGGVSARNIARWDGTGWSPLGAGVDNLGVLAVACDGRGSLYAGGYFTHAGGIPATYIAKWDGSNWSALGSGSNGNVGTLLADRSGNVYAGGGISVLGGVSASNVGRWDGINWSAMGAGANDLVDGFALDDNGHLYVAGNFTRAGDKSAGCVARYDVPSIASFAPNAGPAGTHVTITGNNLAGVTSVTFNGISASFSANSNTSLDATVPAGATAGPIRVASDCAGALSRESYFTAPCAPVPLGLVAWWRLDGNANDLLNGHDGVVIGDNIFAPGIQGQSFRAGPGTLIEVPNAPGLNPTDFTLDAWVKLDTLPEGIAVVLWKGDDFSNFTSPFELAVYGSGQQASAVGRATIATGSPSGVEEVVSNTLFPLGRWVHLATTADGSHLKLYQDGALVGSKPQTVVPGPSSYPLKIGGTMPYIHYLAFPGLIDEVEIHVAAATASEIRAIYEAGPASKCLSTSSVASSTPASILTLAAAPNPAISSVALSFSVPAPALVWLDIFDVSGRRVRSLLRGQLTAGDQRLTWDGRNDSGDRVVPGIYLARMRSRGEVRTARVVMLGK